MTPERLSVLRNELARLYGEDIAQDTILKYLEHLAAGETIDKPEHWCRKTAWGEAKHAHRRKTREVLIGDMHPEHVRPNDTGSDWWGGQIVSELTQPATQHTRLEARETLGQADPRLVDETLGEGQVRSKDARKRMRRQAEPHAHRPRKNRPGRCSRCGLGRQAEVHVGREGV